MARNCTICFSENRAAIDAALVAGTETLREVSIQYRLSLAAVHRHRRNHLPLKLRRAAERAKQKQNAVEVSALAVVVAHQQDEEDDLFQQAHLLRRKALTILRQAEDAGQLGFALSAIREARSVLDLMGRLDSQRQVANKPSQQEMVENGRVMEAFLERIRAEHREYLALKEELGRLRALQQPRLIEGAG